MPDTLQNTGVGVCVWPRAQKVRQGTMKKRKEKRIEER